MKVYSEVKAARAPPVYLIETRGVGAGSLQLAVTSANVKVNVILDDKALAHILEYQFENCEPDAVSTNGRDEWMAPN